MPSGTVAFIVTNKDSSRVSEAELRTQDLKSILGEQENLTPGLSGRFTLRLAAGSYKLSCPGAKQDTWDFAVTQGAKVAEMEDDPALVKLTVPTPTTSSPKTAQLPHDHGSLRHGGEGR